MSGTNIHFRSLFLFYFRFRLSNKHHHRPLHYAQPAKPTTFCRPWFLVPFVISFFFRLPSQSSVCTISGPRPQNDRIMGSLAVVFISHFSLSFIVFWPMLPDDISILSDGTQVNHLKIHIHQFTSSPCPIRFSTIFFFSSHFWREYKKGAHAHPSVSFLHLDYHLFSFIIPPESFFAPDKHTRAIARLMPIIFMFRSSSVSRCTLFGIYSPPSQH